MVYKSRRGTEDSRGMIFGNDIANSARRGGPRGVDARQMRLVGIGFAIALGTGLAGCSGQGANIATLQPGGGSASPAVAVRTQPVVPGRRARVFIFAGLGDKCEQLPAPEISITQPPAKGDVTFVPGQETTIQYSAKGTCVGQKATGTAVYYTAWVAAQGVDTFVVTAKLGSGETATRSFEIAIAE